MPEGRPLISRILIVDDEVEVAELVSDVLQMEGYETHIAVGSSAMENIRSFDPALVLLDLMMPEVSGFEVARCMHEASDTRDIPIVVMTAVRDPDAQVEHMGVETCLSKPFDIEDLIGTVEHVLIHRHG